MKQIRKLLSVVAAALAAMAVLGIEAALVSIAPGRQKFEGNCNQSDEAKSFLELHTRLTELHTRLMKVRNELAASKASEKKQNPRTIAIGVASSTIRSLKEGIQNTKENLTIASDKQAENSPLSAKTYAIDEMTLSPA